MDSGMASFLREAIKQQAAVDLHCDSGTTFTTVTPTGILHDTVEVATFNEGHRFVVMVSKIEWAVLATYGEGELPL